MHAYSFPQAESARAEPQHPALQQTPLHDGALHVPRHDAHDAIAWLMMHSSIDFRCIQETGALLAENFPAANHIFVQVAMVIPAVVELRLHIADDVVENLRN